jgi:hypothetical protein
MGFWLYTIPFKDFTAKLFKTLRLGGVFCDWRFWSMRWEGPLVQL